MPAPVSGKPVRQKEEQQQQQTKQEKESESSSSSSSKLLHFDEVAKHSEPHDCWCVFNGKAFDLTGFVSEGAHPGGSAIITELAGKDATQEFLHAHPEDIIVLTMGKHGHAEAFKGHVDTATIPASSKKNKSSNSNGADSAASKGSARNDIDNLAEGEAPPLKAVLNVHDFEAIAQRVMAGSGRRQAWDYYSSGAADELTYVENVAAFQRIWLRPRILVDVHEVDTSCTLMGSPASFPVYLSAVAMCGMGHPDGEVAWGRAAGNENTVFMVPNLNSRGFDTIVNEGRVRQGQPLWFQIYVNPDRTIVLDQLKACESAGVTALCITVDSAVAGKRERDLRNKIRRELQLQGDIVQAAANTKPRKAGQYANRDPSLNWDDVAWFQKHTSMKIVIKGVQTGADAVLAARAGCHAIILSNHGGRNLDTARSGIEVLPEVMRELKAAGLQNEIDVFVDGGVRRGTDILKAIALGAKGVGVGKPAVYAMSAYGQEGIERMLQILREELVLSMRLCGVTSLDQLGPQHVNCVDLEHHTTRTIIPKSPFAPMAASQKPKKPKTKEEIRSSIAELKLQLAALEGDDAARQRHRHSLVHVAGSVETVGMAVSAVVTAVARTIFAFDSRVSIHRTGMFLLMYLVVHMLGNLTIFGGPEVFNGYANFLENLVVIKYIEYYLLLAFALHIVVAFYRAYTTKVLRGATTAPMSVFRRLYLLLSGLGVLTFVLIHLQHFKFNPLVADRSGGQEMDFFALELDVFSNDSVVVGYCVALLAMGVHLYLGWSKAVHKMQLDKAHGTARFMHPVRSFGHACAVAVTVGFLACVLWARYQSSLLHE